MITGKTMAVSFHNSAAANASRDRLSRTQCLGRKRRVGIRPEPGSRVERNRANEMRTKVAHPSSGRAEIQSTASEWTGWTANRAAAANATAGLRVNFKEIANAARTPAKANRRLRRCKG